MNHKLLTNSVFSWFIAEWDGFIAEEKCSALTSQIMLT